MYKCECGREFYNARSLSRHRLWCSDAVGEEKANKMINSSKHRSKRKDKQTKNKEIDLFVSDWISEEHKCEYCGKIMTEYYGSGRFCCLSCKNSYVRSSERKSGMCLSYELTPEQRHERSVKSAKTRYEHTEPYRIKRFEDAINNIENRYHHGNAGLRNDLYKYGYKEWKCECCGRTEFMGYSIPIELHHIDGNRSNNSLDNLQFLCPNCHAQTPNFRWKKKFLSK